MRKGEYLYFTGIGLHHRGRWYFDNEKAATRRQDISCMGCSHMRYSYMLCSMARILGAILLILNLLSPSALHIFLYAGIRDQL